MKQKFYLLVLLALVFQYTTFGQSTTINNGLTASTSTSGPTITFAVNNTNNYPIAITEILDYHLTGNNGHTYTLWYTSVQITGQPTIQTPNWNQAATGAPVTNSVSAIIPVLTGFYFVVPANTLYRMAIVHSNTSGSVQYSSSGNQTYSAGGVDLLLGNNPTSPGYTGAFPTPGINGRWLCGGIVFQPACMAPTGLNISNITVNSASVSWSPVSGSLGYEYAINQSATPPATGIPTSSTSANFNGLLLNTSYYVHVRNLCNGAPSSWISTPFTTLNAFCLPPTQILFSNITTTSADVLWSQMPNSSSYEYYWDITPNATPNTSTAVATTGITASLTSLQPYTWYYFYVRSFCLDGIDSSWWKIDSFVTNPDCEAPILQVNNLGSNDPVVYWAAIPNAYAYEYKITDIDTDPAFGTEVHQTSVTASLPADGKSKFFHARTKCNSMFTFSPWSTVQLRATGISSASINPIEVYPNPVTEVVTIEGAKNSTYSVVDMSGRLLRTGNIENERVQLVLSDLPAGVYLLKMQSGAGVHQTKLIKR